jgi:hypothetical protein
MRDRLRTPFFPVPWGNRSTVRGAQSPPGRTVPARAMVGRVVGDGRYLLREKTGHSVGTVSYSAHDMVGEINVALDLHPDVQQELGYRMSRTVAVGPQEGLPNLYRMEFTADIDLERAAENTKGFALRVWRALRSAFRRRG